MLRFAPAGLRIKTKGGQERMVRFTDVTPEKANQQVEPWWDEAGIDQSAAYAEEDREWDWTKLANHSLTGSLPDCVGLETPDDSQLQGALWLDKPEDSQLEAGKQSLHVQRVATAPRNRQGVVDAPHFAGVGKALIIYAVLYSYAIGHEGRVILSALPKAVPFYEKLKFVSTGRKDNEDLPEYELPASEAKALLQEWHYL